MSRTGDIAETEHPDCGTWLGTGSYPLRLLAGHTPEGITTMPPPLPFGNWIKQRRKALDLTQADLARLVGCSPDAIYRIEAGTRRPSKQIADRLARELDVPGSQVGYFLRRARAALPSDAEETNDFDAVPARAVHSAGLLAYRAPLIGREQELDDLRELLLRDSVRLITLLGPAGVGKTRLSLELATTTVDDFDDGICIVPLAAVTEPDLVADTIAQALDIPQSSEHSARHSLRHYLYDRRLLLILDNFEQVLGAAPLIAELLGHCAWLKIVITSRERLRLWSEWSFDLEGLAYPPETASGSLEHYGAVRLFAHRAQQRQRRWNLHDEAAAVVRITRLVEGLPLALELAAAAVSERTCAEIAADLEVGLPPAAPDAYDIPLRHRSIEAALDYSWRLLSDEQRRAFPCLAVFRGGFDEAAAVQIAETTPHMLTSLLHKSLLRQIRTKDGIRRYQVHELVLHYAEEKLRTADTPVSVQQRHLTYFLALAEQARSQLIGPHEQHWARHLEHDHDNLRAALRWALNNGQVEAALRLTTAMERFWYVQGYWSEGRSSLERALTLAARPSSPTPEPHAHGGALIAAANLASSQNDYPQAEQLFQDALTLFGNLGDDLQIARIQQGQATIALDQRDYDRAYALFERSLPVLRSHNDHHAIGRTLHGIGSILLMQGNLEAASTLFAEGAAHYRLTGDKGAIASALSFAAGVARRRGDLPQATMLCLEAIDLCRELGHKLGLAWALRYLGDIAQDKGDYDHAQTCYSESLRLRRELQDRQGVAWALEGLAEVACNRHQPERAAWLWGQAATLRTMTGAPLEDLELATYQQYVATARTQIDAVRFAAAWQAGSQMSLEDAVANALPENTTSTDGLDADA